MWRAFSRGTNRAISTHWQFLRTQYRRMTQAIRFGDLSEASLAYDQIKAAQQAEPKLSLQARLAFEALGDAITSGSLEDASDGLRLLHLVLESARDHHTRNRPGSAEVADESPAETLRSGVVPAYGSVAGEELPETATVFDIEDIRRRSTLAK